MSGRRGSAAIVATKPELVADGIVHAVGLTFAVAACIALAAVVSPRADHPRQVALAIYAVGLASMFACSALYNLTREGDRKNLFRRLDHAAIFLMIAGTYSPFTLSAMAGEPGHKVFVFVWSVALAGIVAKLFFPLRFDRLSTAVYLLLGWTIVADLGPLSRVMPTTALVLLAGGGFFYSFGVLFHLWTRLRYQNAIWHGFVLAGAGCQYAAVVCYVGAT